MYAQPFRRRHLVSGSRSARRMGLLFGLALILVSPMVGSLSGIADTRAQADPQATEVPEVAADTPTEDERNPDEKAPEESKATEMVTEESQPAAISETEASRPVEAPPVDPEAVATEAKPSPTENPDLGSSGDALWAANFVELDVHGCPFAVDPVTSSLARFQADCTGNVGPVAFTLDNGRLGVQHILTNGGNSGNHATLTGLVFEDDYAASNAGEGYPVVLAAAYPAGYESVAVSCTYWNAAAGAMEWGPALMSMAGDRAIEIAVDAGDTLFCDWFFMPPRYQGEDSANVDIPPIAPTATEIDPTTPEPTPPADPVETGSVHIVKYTCPEGYDTSGAGFAELEKECRDDAMLTEFTVSTVGRYHETQPARLTLPPFMQEAEFDDVPATTIYISETILPGFGEPIVYCAVGARTVAEWIPQRVNGGDTVYWKLEPKSNLDCYFFNTQAEGGGKQGQESIEGDYSVNVEIPPIAPKRNTVTVTKYTCPEGVVRSDENVRLYDQCQEPDGPVEFTVTGGAGYVSSAFSDGSIPRPAVFTGVPFGEIKIAERVPKGYGEPIAFCSDGLGNLYPVPVDGDTVTWNLRPDAGAPVRCVFYNLQEEAGGPGARRGWAQEGLEVAEATGIAAVTDDPVMATETPPRLVEPTVISIESGIDPTVAGDPEPTADPDPTAITDDVIPIVIPGVDEPTEPGTAPATSRVTVFKLTCPEGVARSSAASTLFEQCRENPGPVEFSVTGAGGYSRSAFTPDADRLIVAFTDVPFGEVTISETVPAGFGEPLAFCADSATDGSEAFTPVPVGGGNAIAVEHRADAEAELRCGFVNFQEGGGETEPETGIVRVAKYTCPAGVARSDDDYLLSEQCREKVAPVEFTVSDGGLSLDQTQTASTGVPQEATFTDVPFGSIAISENVPVGYGSPQVFCTDTPADGPGAYEPVAVVFESAVEWNLRADAGIPLTCLFFNFVDEGETTGNQLTVTRFDCPEGTSRAAGLPELGTTCDALGRVEFTATYGASASTDTTDGSGNAGWTGVPVGPWSLQEAIPAGHADPEVYCGPVFTTEAPEVPAPGGLIAGEFAGTGEHLVCTVFNFADGDDPGTGTVRVMTYTCPAGVERSDNDYLLSEQCHEEVAPVEFTVAGGGGYLATREGALASPPLWQETTFPNVPFGTIEISETVPAGYGEPLAFCTDTAADGPGNYEPVPVDGNAIVQPLRAEAEIPLTCLFFNVASVNPSQADAYVTLLPDTGVAPQGAGAARAGAALATAASLCGVLASALRRGIRANVSRRGSLPAVPRRS